VAIGVPARRAPDGHIRRPLAHDVAMSLAGPITNVLLSLLLLALAIVGRVPQGLDSWFVGAATLSTIVALLNMIPLPGLDGGHLLVLGLAGLGVQWSPEREAILHRVGLRLGAAGCMVLLVARFGNTALHTVARVL
jgi:Zn-dependent protease